ncbi:MAG: hypothetical protein IPM72_13245 [Chitinophagaceae bacterium]|nr:hypothetical protein [Chitinophagaceae bacterium]
MEVLYFLKVLYRKKWIILGLSLLAAILTLLLIIKKQPLYVSTAQYSTGFTTEKLRLADGSSAIDIYTIEVKFDNVIATITSPQVINYVGYSLLLHDLTDTANAFTKLGPKQMQTPYYREMQPDTAKRILLNKLAKNELLKSDVHKERVLIEYFKLYGYDYKSIMQNLMVHRVDRTDYLDISYQSTNPELAAVVVNKVGDEFLNYYKTLNSKRTSESAENINSMIDNQQRKVDSLNKLLINEKISQGSFDPLSRSSTAMETVSSLESKLADEKGKYNEHSNRVVYLKARLNSLSAGSNSGTNNNAEVVRLTKQKDDLTKELARKGGNDPVLQQQISDLRAEIVLKSNSGSSKSKSKDEIDKITREINEEEAMMNAAASTISDYTASIRKYSGMTNVSVGSDVKMDVIRSQLDIENKQLISVKDKYTQVQGLSKDDPTVNFIQTRVGQPAPEPQSKNTLISGILSGFAVFFLLSVLFIFLEIFDSSIKLPSVFGKLTKMKTASILNSLKFKKQSATNIMLGQAKPTRGNELFKNNIRKLRFELLNSGKSIFLFTSTQPHTGKSTVLEALASSLLLSNKKVLVLDLNFSHNTLTEKYSSRVFIEDFAGSRGINPAQIKNAQTEHEGLYVIGCKGGNTTPSEELHNLDMKAFLDSLKQEFDFVLIEGAAMNNYADSKEIAVYAEGVFTVFAADNRLSPTDYSSLKYITENSAKNFGAILNKVNTDNINT